MRPERAPAPDIDHERTPLRRWAPPASVDAAVRPYPSEAVGPAPVEHVTEPEASAARAEMATSDVDAAIVRAAVPGTVLPVSAKVRAGIEAASRLVVILDAAATCGAAMVALHARLRVVSYVPASRWERFSRVAAFFSALYPRVALVRHGGV